MLLAQDQHKIRPINLPCGWRRAHEASPLPEGILTAHYCWRRGSSYYQRLKTFN
ncbi:rCG22593 [Rattus norvegicus]|uniref:RCG22593 n=1 Tax=Rattus norvegicus TaxID=10116 RepID=A6IPD2_RAT|nr:rCG22593 [Rattus norvegicus]